MILCAGAVSIAFGCSGSGNCADTATCAAATTTGNGEGGATSTGDGGPTYAAPPPPANCDPSADPKDSVGCVADSFALFVDSVGGIDTNPGTKQLPLKTITAAMDTDKLAGRTRVYACTSGVYDERVVLAANVSLVGGHDCNAWKYSTKPTRIGPTKAGVALTVGATTARIQIADLDVIALDGVLDAESSIAMLVSGAQADLRRLTITAGKGIAPTFVPGPPLSDHAARTPAAGAAMSPSPGLTCNCNFGLSVGGAGGDGAAADKTGKPGSATPPPNFPDNVHHPGTGGTGTEVAATPGNSGSPGEPGKAGSVPAASAAPGTYTDKDGWVPLAATAGTSGWPGVGGGGGGGYGTGEFGGGGGGCGGCGGYGGYGGRGGGSSIALLASNADLALFACTLTANDAGTGGIGGPAASGTGGAVGSPGGGAIAGAGGTGGPGAGGAGGSGGNGGVSTAIIQQKSTVTPDANTKLSFGKSGAGGTGGPLGAGGQNSDYVALPGQPGASGGTFTAQAMIEIPAAP